MQQAFLSDSLSLKRPLLGGDYNAGGLKIIGVKDPTNPQDAATKGWVDLQYSIPTSEAKQAAAEAKEARDESREIADKFGDVDAAVTGAENARNEAQQAATAANEDALRAISAADKAESIVDVSGTYPDIPTGLAATPDGKYFRVPQGSSSDTAFIYYLNASGTALDVAKIPGLELVNKILNNFAGVKFLRGYGSDAFEIIGIDFHVLDYGSDRMKSAGADIKYGYGTPGKPFSILGIDNQMASFLTSDSLQDAGVTILRGYASSPFAVLGADNQLLLMGSGGSSASSALPETGLLDYLIAMQERAYTGGYLVILCGPGDSLSAGTGGLGAIDAMYSLFAAQLGHGGIGYFAPSNDNTASRDLLNMELVYSGWVDNQTYGKKCGPLNFALVPWTGRTNLFFRVKDASRSNPIYQHDVVEVGFTGTGDAGTSSQFRFRATDRNDDGSIGPAGSGEWQTATVANNPEGSETITIVRVEGLGPGTGRYSLEIEPPASGQAGYPAIVSFNCINSAGGVRVIRYARGGATAAYHLNQTASYQTYWMRYFSPDLVFINLGENDYALTDAEFMAGYSAIVERVQDALPDVPVFLERWYSDNHIKRDAVYDAIQTKYGMLGFNVRDLIRNSNFAFQNGYAYSTTNPADPHPNARGARIIGAYQAKRALLNYAVQSLRK
ncbi:TPA: SGNH/GDSL hydrolase family protein [Klebsiella pneumoniae subsp. pneumoniae]|nr:SGNH/GDSL hydrolase family protein [Klebsiella pneumoniae subsp. pneumoniae]HEE0663983.1 SGNH/GDSL hydrolase family protein [Klebsiella pneumoniae]HBX1788094.1 SGNH/GDSL hydrolase family protein [Klebsiella pneumoniae subsp. pneumoniae]HBX1795807.1 SGNH/GDSL hydrolase family protein [Klebsiella pneumoniae subsp. pneumoniae]HBX1803630.1 SGNH/GDSL hydrolase family protein [Klebsiella pneumoniae subsp. pneumoniae]